MSKGPAILAAPERLDPDAAASGWLRVSFGDIARNSTESVSDPRGSGIERFVGLDDLDAESLRVRRWGNVASGTTFTRLFKPGDVLFGKRRAYQRKAAVPDFPGVCSGDLLVFEPASDRIGSEFLPFVVQSDAFFRHALGTSAGSLSPRTKWKDLARFEFALPSVERQAEIVRVLRAANDHVECLADVAGSADLTLRVFVAGFFRDGHEHEHVALAEVADVRSGLTVNASRRAHESTSPYLRVANVGSGLIDLAEIKEIGADERDVVRYSLKAGDVLVVEGHASAGEVGRSAMWDGTIDPCLHQNHLFCVRAGEAVRAKFLAYAVGGGPARAYFRTRPFCQRRVRRS